jgi:hypothetical protein
MGSSFRQDLNNGFMESWNIKLNQAVDLIDEVRRDLYNCIGSDKQLDNAIDDGGLLNALLTAKIILTDELPVKKKE